MMSREKPWRPGDFLPLQIPTSATWLTSTASQPTSAPSALLPTGPARLMQPLPAKRKANLITRARRVFTREHD